VQQRPFPAYVVIGMGFVHDLVACGVLVVTWVQTDPEGVDGKSLLSLWWMGQYATSSQTPCIKSCMGPKKNKMLMGLEQAIRANP
jgi:hypothetical protein